MARYVIAAQIAQAVHAKLDVVMPFLLRKTLVTCVGRPRATVTVAGEDKSWLDSHVRILVIVAKGVLIAIVEHVMRVVKGIICPMGIANSVYQTALHAMLIHNAQAIHVVVENAALQKTSLVVPNVINSENATRVNLGILYATILFQCRVSVCQLREGLKSHFGNVDLTMEQVDSRITAPQTQIIAHVQDRVVFKLVNYPMIAGQRHQSEMFYQTSHQQNFKMTISQERSHFVLQSMELAHVVAKHDLEPIIQRQHGQIG